MTKKPSRSGGIDLNADEVNITGDVVGRDKIVRNINHIINNITERPLTEAEQADRARLIAAQQLKQGVTTYIERLRDRVTATTDTGGPYKGLLEYRLSDASIFFGRTQAIRDLLEHLQRSSLTILHAESGAGKTSLLQAGISPHLIAAGHLPIYLRPYNVDPSLAIKKTLVANLSDLPQLAESSLHDFLSQVCAVLGADATLYIFLDQFEEFFSKLDETTRTHFISELADCLDDESLNVRWVLALRSEFFGNLANFRPRIRNPFENDFRLNRLTRVEAHEVVAEPAARQGITFEDGLIDTILDDLGKEEVAPPQVQLVCSALYESLPTDTKVVTRKLYDDQHGAEGILREHLGRVLHRDLPAEQRPIAQHALEALVTSDTHRILHTRIELANELTLHDIKPETLDQILNQLVDSRLLRAEEIDGQLSYELAHDYLLTEIQLDPAVQARKAAQELLEQETRAYQHYGTLLSDDKLAILAPRRNELALNNDAQTLIQKSERALKRRQRLVFGGIGLVIALIIIGTISVITAIGAGQQQQAAIQTQHIAETAAANAHALQSTSEAGAAIATTREAVANETLLRSFEQTGIVPVGREPTALAFDGTRLWVANSTDNTVQSIDPTTGQVGEPIYAAPSGGLLALTFDGKRLWVSNIAWGTDSVKTAVRFIDPVTRQIGPPITTGSSLAVPPFPCALAFDTLHQRLWVASPNGTSVQLFDPATNLVDKPIMVGSLPNALVFDGTRIWATNTYNGSVQSIDPTTGQAGAPITVGNGPHALAFDGTRVWVANWTDGTVQAIDPTTNKANPPIAVGVRPDALAFDGVWLWVANSGSNTVQSIDPITGQVSPNIISTGKSPVALAVAQNRLWIANDSDNTVQAVGDVRTSDVSLPIAIGFTPTALAYDGTRLWAANDYSDTIQSIDPTTWRMSPAIFVGHSPRSLAYDGSRLWIAISGTLQSIDSTTGQLDKSITTNFHSAHLVFDGTRLLAISAEGLQAVDPATSQISTIKKWGSGDYVPFYRQTAAAFDGTRLWVPAIAMGERATTLWIDPTSGKRSESNVLVNSPLAFDGTWLWTIFRRNDNFFYLQSIDVTTGESGPPFLLSTIYGPTALTYDGNRLWVGNDDGTIQYIRIHKIGRK